MMKIYFCDGCNESVPLGDVQAGRVTTIKGKLFCGNCIPPGSLGAPAAPVAEPARSSGQPLIWMLVLALVVWTVWRDRELFSAAPDQQPEPGGVAVTPAASQGDLDEALAGLAQLRADGMRRGKDLNSLRADVEALRAEGAELSLGMAEAKDTLERIGRSQAETGRLLEKVELAGSRFDAIESRLDALGDAVTAHQAAISAGLVAGAEPRGGAMAGDAMLGMGNAQPVADPVDPAHQAVLDEVRRLLKSDQADLRFEGVDRVEESAYHELADELVALLQDEDMFVRMHAMKVLGDFGHEPAVPALFDVLEDDNAAIRKTAAENLVRLTGYDPGFDPKGTSAERARSTRKWREWFDNR